MKFDWPDREKSEVNNREATRSAVAMRTDLFVELRKIMVDPVQLQQMFMKFMLNAIEAMKDSGGELTVKSQREKDGQLLSRSAMQTRDYQPGKLTKFFLHSSRSSSKAGAWCWPSAIPSSNRIAADCGPLQ